jgi:hypothetical protein
MRLAPLCLLLLLLGGCARWTGLASAKREAMSDALEELRFPFRSEEAAYRLRSQASLLVRCERLPSGEVRCGGCPRGRCFQLLEQDGYTRVVAKDPLTEVELASIWQPLDPPSLREFRADHAARVLDKWVDQEERFEPRWGLTGGILAGLSTDPGATGAVGIGGRLGVRRWFTMNLLGHAAFEYRYRGEHELSLRFGVEVARWTDGRLWGNVGVPPASVSMFIGPLLRMPALRGGLRTGVGVHITDLASVPFFVEAAAETSFAGESSRVAGTFTVGAGL